MREVWKVARWEFMRNVTNKQFIIGLLITPLIMVVFAGLPALLERWNQPAQLTYYVIDEVEVLSMLQEGSPDNLTFTVPKNPAQVEQEVRDADAAGYLVVREDFVETGTVDLVLNEMSQEGRSYVQAVLTQYLQQRRIQHSQLDWEALQYVTAPVHINVGTLPDVELPVGEEIVVSTVFVLLVFVLVFSSGTMLMQSALQEKRDRMAEVVLSSISPRSLMQGKILGHFLLGALQLAFWLTLIIPTAVLLLDFPVGEALMKADLGKLAFFGLGAYLLYAALFVGMGATMEDLQSASNSQGMVFMLPMLSFLFIPPVVSNPNGFIAVLASIFPFTSSVIMIVRSSMVPVPLWQMLLSAGLLVLTAAALALMAAKIFRVGMLMYGKNATMSEIIKWLRYKEE